MLKKGNPDKGLAAGLGFIKDILNEAVAEKKVPGAAFLLAHKSEIIFEEYAGIADLQTGRPFDQDTIKLLASSSKPVSASAIMTLVDEGKISLDDPISKYLPEYREFKVRGTQEKVPAPTLGQCLSHTSGIFGLMQATPKQHWILREPSLSLAESARLILKEDLATKPGTFFAYSGAAFQVAGLIAELVTGQPFEEIARDRICAPLGMKDTMYPNQMTSGEQWDRLDTVCIPDGKGKFNLAVKLDRNRVPRLVLPAGSMVGTCRDFLTFLQMHLNGGGYGEQRVLSKKAVDEMRKVRTLGLDRDRGVGQLVEDYGLGWFTLRYDSQGLASLYRHGGQFGTSAWIDRDRDLVAFWATNVPSALAAPVLEKIFYKVQEIIPGPRTPFTQQQPATGASEPPVIDEYSIEPLEIRPGERATITWFVTGLDMVARIEPEIGSLGSFMVGATQNKGLLHVSPKSTTTYTLVASNPRGEVSKSISLKVI
jgi:CubicO group peptidase (beta-lactamase class C family)